MRANRWSRAAFALAGVVVVGLPAGRTVAQTPERHGKTIKQCHDELAANAAALTKAGESPAEFFHTCWWRTAEGHPTPIRGMAKGGAPPPRSATVVGKPTDAADAGMAKAKAEIARAKQEAADAEADAARNRKAMTIEAAKAEAATKAEKAAQARATAAEAAVKAQAEAEAQKKTRAAAEAKASADAAAQERAEVAERAEAKAKREAEARGAAEARLAAQAQAAAKARAAADAAAKIEAEEAEKVAAATKALAAAKAQQAARAGAATTAARAAGEQVTAAAPAKREAMPRKQAAAHVVPRAAFVEHRPIPRLMPRRPRETVFVPRVERRRIRVVARRSAGRAAEATPVVQGAPAPAPIVVFVPVHVAGVPAPIPIAVLPGVAPAFRKMVNHPTVPGFTSTP